MDDEDIRTVRTAAAVVASLVALGVGQLAGWWAFVDAFEVVPTHGEPTSEQGPIPSLVGFGGILGVPFALVWLWRRWVWLLAAPLVTVVLIGVPTIWADIT